MVTTYRVATPEDVEPLYDLLCLMHAENGLASMSEDRVRARIRQLLAFGQIIVAEQGGEIVGSIGLIVESWWYSKDQHVADSWIFVHPEHRKGRAIFKLLEAAKVTAQAMGMPLVVGLVGPKDIDRKMKLFARDMDIRGVLFVKED